SRVSKQRTHVRGLIGEEALQSFLRRRALGWCALGWCALGRCRWRGTGVSGQRRATRSPQFLHHGIDGAPTAFGAEQAVKYRIGRLGSRGRVEWGGGGGKCRGGADD